MSDKKPTLLDKVKKIHVPAHGTGEFVVLPSVEALCVWMQLNQLKVKGWRGNFLDVMPDVPAVEELTQGSNS